MADDPTPENIAVTAFAMAEENRLARLEDYRRSQSTTATPAAPALEIKGKHYAEITAHIEGAYLIKGVLAAGGLVLEYGPPGSGKTHIATDWGLHVAAGQPWHGRRVRGGLVIYFAIESPASVENRIVAWRAHHGFQNIPFVVSGTALDMRDPLTATSVIEFIQATESETGARVALVVFDTFSRSIPGGDENSAGDMSAAVAQYDHIRAMTGATVLLVHHSGKDVGRGARGSTVLSAAADTIISVSRSDMTGEHLARIEKQRDGAVGAEFAFKLEVSVLGEDEDGDQVTTCVLIPTDKRATRHPLTSAEQIALAALNAGLLLKKRIATETMVQAGARPGQLVMLVEDWRQACYEAGISQGETAEGRKKAFRRVRESLPIKGHVTVSGEWCWLTCDGGTS